MKTQLHLAETSKIGESYGDSTQLIYLRARYYSPADGRFISRDTWGGDMNSPISMNRWAYTNANPINLTDPSGFRPCNEATDPMCVSDGALILKNRGLNIKEAVRSGSLLPVEGLAQLADYAMSLYEYDMEQAVWALTIVIGGFDPNREEAIWKQGWTGIHDDVYWLGYDWLPYQNSPSSDVLNWDNTGKTWVHSRRGDWRKDYWDKTANQAYHFWFPVAVTFYDNVGWAHIANIIHDSPVYWEDIDSLGDGDAPLESGYTQQDWNLSLAGMNLGQKLYSDQRSIERILGYCSSNKQITNLYYQNSTKIGSWIRSNLK